MLKSTRIGKLQHWILTTAYRSSTSSVTKLDIYRRFYHIPCHAGESGYHVKAFFDEPSLHAAKAVSLSRCLRLLCAKGLIIDLKGFYEIALTDAGKERARELLNS